MALQPGTRLGAYEIVGLIGAGGMGEVYRARDTRLKRDVAVKVLPDAFISDAERLARFQREAELLATLNHPNIAQIYGLEGTALVLELVDGPTLADRIAQGPIPIDEALPIARQIAEGLAAAHEHGIIHRDLKPANIKLKADGTVKVLDFGLAKAAESSSVRPDLSAAPTITSPAMTMGGVILGTAAYMSPEQAKGKAVDKRTDVWSFGCVLFEMLTAKRVFDGEDVSDTLVALLRSEPAWTELPPAIPEAVRKLLRRTLEKDPRRRLADIADARFELEEAAVARTSPASTVSSRARLWQRPVPALIFAAIIAGSSGFAVWSLTSAPNPVPQAVRRVSIVLPDAAPYDGRGLAISPDGSLLVYAASVNGRLQLHMRQFDQLESKPLRGTAYGRFPFFSPDGEWIGFFSDDGQGVLESKLKKIPLRGGPAQILCDAPNSRGGAWSEDGTIVFGSGSAGDSHQLFRVSANGGTPEPLGDPDPKQGARGWPQILPGGTHVLFSSVRATTRQVEVLALDTGESRVIVDNGFHARYTPTEHLVYMVGSTLMTAPFNVASLKVTGPAVALIEGIQGAVNGAASFAVTSEGMLVYAPGAAEEYSLLSYGNLVIVDRDGRATPVSGSKGVVSWPRLSPDDTQIVLETPGDQSGAGLRGNTDIWVYDVRRGTREPIARGAAEESFPVWTPDGSRILYLSTSTGGLGDLSWQPLDRAQPPQLLLKNENRTAASSWTPDGNVLAFYEIHPKTRRDIWTLKLGEKPQPYIVTPSEELAAAFSPDGKWIAYVSEDSGERQVYVQSYPVLGRRHPVSTDGGEGPVWSHDGRELFYFRPQTRLSGQLMVVDVKVSPTISLGTPRVLFEGPYVAQINGNPNYDVFRDSQRFVMIQNPNPATDAQTAFVAVFNWFEELERLASP